MESQASPPLFLVPQGSRPHLHWDRPGALHHQHLQATALVAGAALGSLRGRGFATQLTSPPSSRDLSGGVTEALAAPSPLGSG